jgi:hypothetical protein
MTEAEWLACNEPDPMLAFMRRRLTQRKLRLFAVACCRHVWEGMTPYGRLAVEVAERFADGQPDRQERAAARAGVNKDADAAGRWNGAMACGFFVVDHSAWKAANVVACNASGARPPKAWLEASKISDAGRRPSRALQCASRKGWEAVDRIEAIAQSRFLRDMIPFHRASIDAAVLVCNHNTIVRLAQAAYENRILPAGTLDNSLLAILADALEEAGCAEQEIFMHLRRGGEHYRGCWVVDLVRSVD